MSNRAAQRHSEEDSGHDEPTSPSTVGVLHPPIRLLHSQQRSPVVSRNASISGSESLPAWTRGTSISLHSRTSRASSVISTGTRVSVSTVHDEDRHTHETASPSAGERYWLGLDGQIVHTREVEVPHRPYHDVITQPGSSRRENVYTLPQAPTEGSSNATEKPAPPDLAEHPAFGSSLPPDAVGVSRNPSFTPGKETITVKKHHQSQSLPVNSSPRAASPGESLNALPLRRVGGIKLRVVTHTGQGGVGLSPLTPNSGLSSLSAHSQSRSAGSEADRESPSAPYCGLNASDIFPSPADLRGIAVGKVDLDEGKALRTADLSPENRRNRRSSGSPAQLRRRRPEPELRSVSKDSGIDVLGIETPNHVGSLSGLAKLEGSSHHHFPTSAELEGSPFALLTTTGRGPDKDFCAHCSHIVQALDRKGRVDSLEGSKFICDLAQQVLDLKTELIQTKQDLQTVQHAPIPRGHDGPTDPLFPSSMKLGHVNTIKRAMRRRAAKVHPESSHLSQGQSSSPYIGYSNVHPALRPPHTPPPATQEPRTPPLCQKTPPSSESALRTALHTTQTQNLGLTASVRALETELSDLRTSLTFWVTRSRKFENLLTTTEQSFAKKEEELRERMRRIDGQGRGLVERAVKERDEEWANEWARKNKSVLERLKAAEAQVGKSSGAREENENERVLQERLAGEVKAREKAEREVRALEGRLKKLQEQQDGKKDVGEGQVTNVNLSPEIGTGGPVSPVLSTGSGRDGIDTWIDAMDGVDSSPPIR